VLTSDYMRATGLTRPGYHRSYKALHDEVKEGLSRLIVETRYKPVYFGPQKMWTFLAEEAPAGFMRDRYERFGSIGACPISEFGLGWHSRSRLFGRAVYDREPAAFTQAKPVYKSAVVCAKDEMASYILTWLYHHSRLEYAAFHKSFGLDVRGPFALELSALRSAGKIIEDGTGFSFVPKGFAEGVFYGLFFLLDAVEQSPFSTGPVASSLRRRLEGEMLDAAH
ncbi:MAG: hypothetical protein AAB262_04190, partial [Elusimicrobiota bacterium]